MTVLSIEAPLVDKGFVQEDDFGVGGIITLTVPAGAWVADVGVEAQNARLRFDGTSPSTTVGHRLIAGAAPFRIVGRAALVSAEFCEEVDACKLNVQFWGG